jgi:protease-4
VPRQEGLWFGLLRSGLKTLVVSVCIFVGLGVAVLGIAGCAAAIAASGGGGDKDKLQTDFSYGVRGSKAKLLSLPVDGVILGEDPGRSGLFDLGESATYGYTVKDQLRKAARDSSIAGVVLEMSTPGGTIFGAQAIADGIREYQKATGKPVLAFVKGLSASGGMWAMAPANRILADNGSLIGSIGVIMGPFEYYDGVTATDGGILGGGITTKNGISSQYLTAGRDKDLGNPYRQMTLEERTVLQRGLDSLYAQFVTHVSTYRKIPEATIRDQLGAHIFGNADAQSLGLIDGTANQQDAYAQLARMANVAGTWQVVRVHRSSGLAALFGESNAPQEAAKLIADTQAAQLCFAPGTTLAFYGDPTAICHR